MKHLIYMTLAAIILSSCGGKKDQFTISGKIAGADTGMVYLEKYETDHWMTIDSTRLEKGAFTFKGQTSMPEMWHIAFQEKEISLPLFVENAAIEVEIYPDSLDKSRVSGSVNHDIYKQYVALQDAINVKMEEAYAAWKAAKESGDSVTMAKSDSISTDLDKQMKVQLMDFVKSNSTSVVAPYLVMRNSWQFELPELESMVSTFDTSLNKSQYFMALQKRVDILKSVEIGQIAPDFTMNDSTGAPVALSSLKGKVLLVDFWASWCGPCRAENPNVVKAYQAFNKKGFDILGVSFDQNREKWLKAVKDDKLTWHHVSDLKGWGNAAGKLYGVNSIPSSVLLDKDQKIIARNLRGEELISKLEEILGPAKSK